MASINKVILVGNLGRDPETRTFPSGDMVCNITIATTDKWKDKESGEARENTEWHRVVFNGRLAEIAAQYLRKGSQVYIEGALRTRKYQKDGVDHYATEIRADQMQMLGSRQDGGGGGRDQGGYGDSGQQQGRQQPQQQRQAPQQGQQRQAPQGQQQGQAQGQQRGGYGQHQQPQQRQQPQQDQRGGGGGGFQGDSGFDSMESDIPFIDCSMIHDM